MTKNHYNQNDQKKIIITSMTKNHFNQYDKKSL